MKRLILVLGLLLLCFNFVSAADCTMRNTPCGFGTSAVDGFWFFATTNTHGSTVSTGYNYFLCCDSALDLKFTGGTNNVIGISSLTNAHFATSYVQKLRITNATCRTTASCVGNEFCLFSLASLTNSHASRCNTAGYNIDICCNSTIAVGPGLGVCGDGITNVPNNVGFNEQCDDGNLVAGDGCSPTCTYECGDGVLDSDNSDSAGYEEDCEGLNLNGESCSSLGWTGGSLSCYPAGNINQCIFNTGACFNTGTEPPVVGPNEYYVYGDCLDDGDGDEFGEANWTIYSGDGTSTNNGVIVCQLTSEEVPLFGNLSFLIFLTILGGFYIHNYLRRCNKCKL